MAIIMQSPAMISLILLIIASVTDKAVFAQERIRIATAGGLSIVPVWVMQDKELLKKRGVVAEVVQISSSPVAIQATLSGEVEAIVTSAATLVTSRLAGADVTMIMSTTPTLPSVLVAAKSITEVNQLMGRPAASIGSAAIRILVCGWCCARTPSIRTRTSN